jgi:hypothetical protein
MPRVDACSSDSDDKAAGLPATGELRECHYTPTATPQLQSNEEGPTHGGGLLPQQYYTHDAHCRRRTRHVRAPPLTPIGSPRASQSQTRPPPPPTWPLQGRRPTPPLHEHRDRTSTTQPPRRRRRRQRLPQSRRGSSSEKKGRAGHAVARGVACRHGVGGARCSCSRLFRDGCSQVVTTKFFDVVA